MFRGIIQKITVARFLLRHGVYCLSVCFSFFCFLCLLLCISSLTVYFIVAVIWRNKNLIYIPYSASLESDSTTSLQSRKTIVSVCSWQVFAKDWQNWMTSDYRRLTSFQDTL